MTTGLTAAMRLSLILGKCEVSHCNNNNFNFNHNHNHNHNNSQNNHTHYNNYNNKTHWSSGLTRLGITHIFVLNLSYYYL